MKILITGGHLTPALAVIDELKKNSGCEIIFVGRKYAFESELTISQEYQIITEKKIAFLPLNAGKLQRIFGLNTLKSFLKIPFGFLKAYQIVSQVKPDIILSFGGYLALPVCFSGYCQNIPIVTHEQTVIFGLANKLIFLLARKVCLSWPSNLTKTNSEKYILTGNPLREAIFNKTLPQWLDIGNNEKLIYLTGGNLGSHILNKTIASLIPGLLEKYILIHQTGENKTYGDYEKSLALKNELKPNLQKRYFPVKYLHEEEIGGILNRADLIISRSGGNTISEILTLKKVALLIPLPWAGGNEQMENAKMLKKFGNCEILEQNKLNSNTLSNMIDQFFNHYQNYQNNLSNLDNNQHLTAVSKIIEIIYEIYQKKSLPN